MGHKPLGMMLWLLTLWLTAPVAVAGSEDPHQPIHIEADQAEVDEPRGIMTYSGHVVLRQGDIQVQAERLVVYSKDGELQRITAQGQPVRYWQQPAPASQDAAKKKVVRGRSQRLEYNTDNKQILLLGQAEFWQGGNRFSGNRIQYDPVAERVIANAGGEPAAEGGKAPRVSVTLQPRKKKAVPTP